MRFIRCFLAVLVLSLCFGCNQSEPIVGGTDNNKPVREVISLSPSTTELVAGTMFGPKLIGRTESCHWPAGPTTDNVEVVMKGIKPNYERIAELHPDLVVYDKSLFSEADVKKVEDLGIRTFGFQANNLEDFCTELFRLGSITGTETSANNYVIQIRGAMERGRVPIEPKPNVAIILPGQGTEHYIAGVDSFIASVVKACGGEPVGPKGTTFVAANIEELVSSNPDFIITGGDPTPITKDARLAGVSAVKTKRLYGLPNDYLTRRGGRVNVLMDNLIKILRKLPTN